MSVIVPINSQDEASQENAENGVRQRGSDINTGGEIPRYFIRPFKEGTANFSCIESFVNILIWLIRQREAQQTFYLVAINLLATLLLLSWCHASRSMALLAYTYLSWFSLLSLVTCLVCVWTSHQRATLSFTYGYSRFEALAVFSSVTLSLLGAIIIVKECFERILEPEEVHSGGLIAAGIVGLTLHLGMTALAHNPPLTQVLRASPSSLLQEHVADMCQSLCNYVPALTKILLPRVNPVILISVAGFIAIVFDQIIIQIYNYQGADSVAALTIAVLTIITMYPLCVCSAKILLQTTPVNVVAQLDKCLREALTLDGVLEFRYENFWTLGVGNTSRESPSISGGCGSPGFILTGSLHVRIRRDANEQMVLAHVKERLHPLVPLLTVQVFKDDWTRSSTTLQLLKDSARTLAISPSHSPHYVNVSYPYVYPSSRRVDMETSSYPHTYFTERSPVSDNALPPKSLRHSSTSVLSQNVNSISAANVNQPPSNHVISKDFAYSRSTVIKSSSSDLQKRCSPTYGDDAACTEDQIRVDYFNDYINVNEYVVNEGGHVEKPDPHYVNLDFSRSKSLQNDHVVHPAASQDVAISSCINIER